MWGPYASRRQGWFERRSPGFRAWVYVQVRWRTSPEKKLAGCSANNTSDEYHLVLPFLKATFLIKCLRERRGEKCEQDITVIHEQAQRRTNVSIAAVKDGLVTAHVFRDVRESFDDAQAEFFTLHLAGDGDILDMPDAAESAQEFALDEDAAGADDAVGLT
jgi:hypothetical protein